MIIQDEILINQFGQNVIDIDRVIDKFHSYSSEEQQKFLKDLLYLIIQSKPIPEDIESSIMESGLKATYTPCVLLRKGVAYRNLKRIIELPKNEIEKSAILLLTLFRLAYKRRFDLERNDPNKWWYWNLSIEENIRKVMNSSE